MLCFLVHFLPIWSALVCFVIFSNDDEMIEMTVMERMLSFAPRAGALECHATGFAFFLHTFFVLEKLCFTLGHIFTYLFRIFFAQND